MIDGIEAVLFDWDRTLATVMEGATLAEKLTAMLEDEGHTYPSAAIRAAQRARMAAVASGKLRGAPVPQTKDEIVQAYRQTLTILGHPDTSLPFARRLYYAYTELPSTLYDDARPVLTALQAAGYRLGIITNNAPTIQPRIEALVGDLIEPEHVVISEVVGIYKPEAGIFQLGAERLGVESRACLFIGDNREVDALGAVRNGGYAYGLWLDRENRDPIEVDEPHVRRITSLHAIPAMLGAASPVS